MKKNKNALREIIRIKGRSMGDIANSLGFSRQTLYNRLKTPDKFTFIEAGIIEVELGIRFSDFV